MYLCFCTLNLAYPRRFPVFRFGVSSRFLDLPFPSRKRFLQPRLTGTNFNIWKVIMLAILESYELAFFIMTDVPKPAEEDAGALWDRINARIRSFIILNVTPTILSHIKHMRDAKAIWTHLASLYERVSPMKRVSLEVQMRMLDPSKSSSMREHINKLQGLQQEVLSMGKKISSEDMAITLMSRSIQTSIRH